MASRLRAKSAIYDCLVVIYFVQNKKYYKALGEAIAGVHARGKMAHVLDIGTGTGLLAMMAARLGADSVTACEVLFFFQFVTSLSVRLYVSS